MTKPTTVTIVETANPQHVSPEDVSPTLPEPGVVSGAHREHGEYHKEYGECRLEDLRPNPRHCRTDWNARDDAFEALLGRITVAGRVTTPLVCTTDVSGRHLNIIKGHRRYAAAQAAGLTIVPVRVCCYEDGWPIEIHQQLEIWLRESGATKSPTQECKTIAVIRWYQSVPLDDPKHQLAQAHVAQLLHVSPSTVNAAKRLAEQSDEVVAAMADGTLPVTTAVKLTEQVTDPTELQALIQRVRDENARREQCNQRPLIDREIFGLISVQRSERTPEVPLTGLTTQPTVAASPVQPDCRSDTSTQRTNSTACDVTGAATAGGDQAVQQMHTPVDADAKMQISATAAPTGAGTTMVEIGGRAVSGGTLRILAQRPREMAKLIEELQASDSNLTQVHSHHLRLLYRQLARPDLVRLLDELERLPVLAWEAGVGSSVNDESIAPQAAAH